MKALVTLLISVFGLSLTAIADDLSVRAWQMESKGDPSGARDFLQKSAQAGSADALEAYAHFLDRHHDAGARDAYEKLVLAAQGEQRQRAARRLVLLDLMADDRSAAQAHLEKYNNAGGRDLALSPVSHSADAKQSIPIPGPLRSFSRMAALSPELAPEDLMPALARNVVTNGYQAASSNEALEQTEYLKLVIRYLSQARELSKLAGADNVIKIETCESPQTGEILRVLGYRMRGGCGSEVVLETVNAMRAFLTIDSGFPLAELEQSLRTNRPFVYDYKPTLVPVLYGADYWTTSKEKQGPDFIDSFLGDPSMCRLYLGLSKLDPVTADELRKGTPPFKRFALTRTCWISMVGCSAFATAERLFPAAPVQRRPGPTWWVSRQIAAGRSSSACWRKTTAGWPATSTPWRESPIVRLTVRC